MAQGDTEINALLARVQAGDRAAEGALYEMLYRELRALAGHVFRSQRAGHTLQPTALVHEAFLKLSRGGGINDRAHFMNVAARAMRQILVNHARDRAAAKRGGGEDRGRVTLSGVADPGLAGDVDVLAVNDALDGLAALDERHGRIAELRLFGGLTNKEIAETIGVSLRTVELDWRMAKAWLAEQLG